MNQEAANKVESRLGFDKVRETILSRCNTDYASDRVRNEQFCTDPSQIKRRLEITDEMRLVMMFEENFPTTGYIDGRPFLEALLREGSSLDVLSLAKLKTLTDTVRRITAFLGGIKDGVYPRLRALAAPVRTFPEVQRRIECILDKYGDIKDSASEQLLRIRREIATKEASLSKRAAAVLRQAQADGISESDAAVNVRDGKFLIPVNASSKRKLPGYVYDQSASGRTVFIEPVEIVEAENEIAALRFDEETEIARILLEFSDFVRPYVPELLEGADLVGEVDFLMAKARTALDYVAGMPVISDDGGLHLRKARHPLLEKALRREGREMVPLTVNLSPEKRILLISGPNAGGKSVCLKTVGLLQYMFQWGMLIPTSESSELPVFNDIRVSIGDDQSLENDLSTYSSFLVNMKEMLEVADEKTLVLIDEFGSGTEPAAGGAIAEAILAEIDHRGAFGVITTHYTNLKLYASGAQTRVENGAMLFDSSSIAPLFALQQGMPGNSFAFELARKMKLPESIVKDAEQRAGEEYVGIERNLRRIARNRRVLDEKIQKIKHTEGNLEQISERYQKELLDIKEQKKAILESARREAEDIVKGAGAQVEKTIRDIKEAQAEKGRTKEARAELQGFLGAIQDKKEKQQRTRDEYIDRKIEQLERRQKKGGFNASEGGIAVRKEAPLKVGEKVRIKEGLGASSAGSGDNPLVGEVSRVSSKAVTVIVGNVSSTLSPDRLERISSNEFKEISRKVFKPALQVRDESITARKLSFKSELDVRGMRLNDALNEVRDYIDDAIMLNVGTVRIIHGKGTGVLHEEIQKYLRSIGGLGVSDEDVRIGGSGVTIVTF